MRISLGWKSIHQILLIVKHDINKTLIKIDAGQYGRASFAGKLFDFVQFSKVVSRVFQ